MSPRSTSPAQRRAPLAETADLTMHEFIQFRELIHEETSIFLGDSKRMLLHGRLLRRVRELGLPCFGDYYELVKKPAEHAEFVRMIDLVTTNETQFFREPHHFDYLEQKAFPEWLAAAAAAASHSGNAFCSR